MSAVCNNSIFLYSLLPIFSFLIIYTVGRTPWTGDQPVSRPLPKHRTTQTQNKRTQTSMPWVGFGPRSQCSSGLGQFMPQTARPLWSATRYLLNGYLIKCVTFKICQHIRSFVSNRTRIMDIFHAFVSASTPSETSQISIGEKHVWYKSCREKCNAHFVSNTFPQVLTTFPNIQRSDTKITEVSYGWW
jgi:hypothetical protein